MQCWRTSMSSGLHSISFQNINIYRPCAAVLPGEARDWSFWRSVLLIISARLMHSESVVEKYRFNIRQNVTFQNKVFPVLKHFDVSIVWAGYFYY